MKKERGPYRRNYDTENPVYCACGCGMELTPAQIRIGGKYASVHCAAKMNLKRMLGQTGTRDKLIQRDCMCGCGEEIPYANRIKNYYFVNKNHEKLYNKQQIAAEEAEMMRQKQYEKRTYCASFDPEATLCAHCYSNGDGEYRGCYVNPKTKSTNEV